MRGSKPIHGADETISEKAKEIGDRARMRVIKRLMQDRDDRIAHLERKCEKLEEEMRLLVAEKEATEDTFCCIHKYLAEKWPKDLR